MADCQGGLEGVIGMVRSPAGVVPWVMVKEFGLRLRALAGFVVVIFKRVCIEVPSRVARRRMSSRVVIRFGVFRLTMESVPRETLIPALSIFSKGCGPSFS